MLEIAEKSLEALIFSCACCARPDIGLEIAMTARKRNWSRKNLERLSKAYSLGKARASRQNSYFFNGALEKSLFCELGFFDEEKQPAWKGVQSIRIITKDKPPGD